MTLEVDPVAEVFATIQVSDVPIRTETTEVQVQFEGDPTVTIGTQGDGDIQGNTEEEYFDSDSAILNFGSGLPARL